MVISLLNTFIFLMVGKVCLIILHGIIFSIYLFTGYKKIERFDFFKIIFILLSCKN